MLSFEEKRQLFNSYEELEEHPVSLGRINFHFPESKRDKKIIIRHLHPNGNGFLYAPFLNENLLDDQGFYNIRTENENDLRELLEEAIQYMSSDGDLFIDGYTENYQNEFGEKLVLAYENKMWLIYAGKNVEAIFPTRDGALGYLSDEGFF